jgi:hypothetical protein
VDNEEFLTAQTTRLSNEVMEEVRNEEGKIQGVEKLVLSICQLPWNMLPV